MLNFTKIFPQLVQILRDQATYKYLIPGAVVTLVYASFIYSTGLIEVDPNANVDDLSWTGKMVHWLSTATLLFTTLIFEFVIITLFSPLMAMLAEHTETSINGKIFNFSFAKMLRDLMRTVGILFTGFVFSVLVILVWKLISWIGNIHVITPYIILIVKAFFIGFSFIDYSLERQGYSISSSWKFAINKTVLMLVIGGLFTLIFSIPIFGVMFAPFVTTIVATLLFLLNVKSSN